MITANTTQQKTPYEMSSNLLGGAATAYEDIANGGALQNINSYMNPFYEQVINSTMGRMNQQRDMTLDNIGDQAQASGAFGGSRHGVAEGVFLGQDALNRADITSGLNMENFNQASGAARSDLFGAAQGATQLGNQYYNIGNNLTDRQMNAGAQQQSFLQQLLSGSADQYDEMVNSPYQALDLFNALNSADPRNNNMTSTSSSTPGLFDYLALAAGMTSVAL